ncbi:hypothetical protein SAMN05446037_102825 [Anaerovirgula multivorans]|uniref:Band 7 domain-containing protein n=1 Tax=Anaerovirgula multivorans TaxID=312168 RepID=A0A239IJH3_9FIRM|nr:hypothetical protein [Anaerovirgula multivorans]SNS93153.1 hypothetical protein SAMN05446037_102825 [Anaerovirgula multivorans]
MLTNIDMIIVILSIFSAVLIYIFLFPTRLFDKYFQIYLEESYDLDALFPIKIKGQIIPKVGFLEIPYQSLNIEINTKTIRGTIVNNTVSLEFIKLSDRRKSLYLLKKHYTKAVKSYITETIRNKKDYIRLIKISTRQKQHIKKVACQTCKHRMKCQIAFDQCNYERKTKDTILSKGIRVDSNKNYELDSLAN